MAAAGIPEIACAQCSAALPANAKFCLECGTPVAAAPEREVRKTVTLLFTDVTGSTAMGESLDPEAYRDVMGRYFDVARTAVERHGGTVEKFVGDAVLAVFGVPDVREDDALRAVRAAAELNAAVAELSAELATTHGVTLAIRTGVNTGSVVAGTARAGGSFATGDAVNTAARLEQAAAPGEILLGADTWELVRDAVDVEPVEAITAKGKAEPVPAYRLITVRADEAGRARRLDAPMVGRDRESRTLEDALESTLSSGRSHLVTVLGAAGLGKTRLVSEFVDSVGGRADVVSGRCVSYGQGITFFPVVQVIRSALRLTGNESDEVVRHALAGALDGATDTDSVVALLMPLLGGTGAPGSHDQTFWAVRRLVEQLAQQRPLVMTVDDLHWAEPTLLDLLEQVRDEVADLPLLLVCGARPELLEEHPDWGRGSMNSVTFGLEPFDAGQIERSVSAILGDGVPGEITTAVAGWSGGNPLFVEEIVNHLVEEGQIRQTPDGWELVGDLQLARMPASVSALLSARLDRLPDRERDVLERVSVVGLDFTTVEALALAEPGDRDGVPATLTALARRDLLRRIRGSDGDTWAFRHIMIRDAAYDALPKALRADLHERFAEAGTAVDAGAERLAFVGHHLDQAVRLRRELAPHDPRLAALAARAAETLALAAEEARDRDDGPAAAALLQRAVEIEHPSPAARRDVLVQLLRILHEQYRIGEAEVATRLLEAATDETATELDLATLEHEQQETRLDTSDDVDPQLLQDASERLEALAREAGDQLRIERAQFGRMEAAGMLARWSVVGRVADEMAESGSPAVVRLAWLMRGSIVIYGGSPLSRVDEFLRPGAVTDKERKWDTTFRAIGQAGTGGDGAREAMDAAAVVWGDEHTVDPAISIVMGAMYHLSGALDPAVEWYGRAIDTFLSHDDVSHASSYLGLQAALMLDRGDPLDPIRRLLGDARRYTSTYDVMSVAINHQVACVLAARSGDLDAAREHAERGVDAVDRSEQVWQRADLRRQVSEWARLAGDLDSERRLLTEARDMFAAKEIVHWTRVCEERLGAMPA